MTRRNKKEVKMTIGYDTHNKCLAVAKTPNNTKFEEMFKICIEKIKKNDEVLKYENILLNLARGLDNEK